MFNKLLSLLFTLFIFSALHAQTAFRVETQAGSFSPTTNKGTISLEEWNKITQHEGYKYVLIQFSILPNANVKKELKANGIELLTYLPKNTYYAKVIAKYTSNRFKQKNIVSVSALRAADKIHKKVKTYDAPLYAIEDSSYKLMITLYPGINGNTVVKQLQQKGATIISVYNQQHIALKLKVSLINEVADLPYVQFVDFINAPMEKENLLNKTNHRSNILNTDYGAGRQYDGAGVRIALTDDGFIGPHIDYTGRTFQSAVLNVNIGDHGDHCAGIIMGAGNLDPIGRGMAPASDLWVYEALPNNNYILDDTLYTSASTNIDIVSTSYSDGCNVGYNAGAESADRQIRTYNNTMRFFSGGNTGTSNCNYGAGSGWGNITGGIKMGKNLIAVANLTNLDVLANSSSRGPASDGRLKPDVSAVGTDVYSTIDVNDYDLKTGTSMSCPGAAGVFAQLYQASRDLNNNQEPNTSILKNILMNTCDDLGNPGPDFKHGYGRINGLRAVKLLENNQYILDSVDNAITKTINLNVPANTQRVKIMLYWHDYEGAISATTALVNDLDLKVTNPNATIFLPWVLDPTPNVSALNSNALRLVDRLNNAEQVTIDTPIAGNYTIDVTGFSVPFGPQEYSISYEFIMNDSLEMVYPIGAEGLVPGETEIIRWDALANGNTFDLDYTIDNGATWITIAAGINANQNYFQWQVPNVLSGSCKLRVSRGGVVAASPSTFSIIGVPAGLTIVSVCPDTVTLKWNSTLNATGYQIFQLGNKYMDSIGTTTDTTFKVGGLNIADEHWFSVKAINANNNAVSRRAFAINQVPGVLNCPLQNDAQAFGNTSPINATMMDCGNISNIPVDITVKNIGTNTIGNFSVHYQVNANPIVSENFSGNILSNAQATHNFSTPISGLTPGNYSIKIWTALAVDQFVANDTITVQLVIKNGVIATLPWYEDFESNSVCPDIPSCDQTDCPLQNNLTNEQNFVVDDFDWKVFEGPTPTTTTGPDVDHTTNSINGKYIYTESSYCFEKSAYLLTPCFDFKTVARPYLSYWYHLYGNGQGSLHLDAFVNGAWQLDIVAPIDGNKGNTWFLNEHDLSAFAGKTVYFRFRGLTGINQRSDMALDDISIVDSSTAPLSITNIENSFSIHPNPASNFIQIESSNSIGHFDNIEITNPLGEVVYSRTNLANCKSLAIDISSYANGIYVVKISGDDGNLVTRKFMKL